MRTLVDNLNYSGFKSLTKRDLNALTASTRLGDGRWDNPKYAPWIRIKGRASAGIIYIASALAKVEKIGWKNYLSAYDSDDPSLVVAWHGSLIVPIYCHRNRNLVIMTSLSGDGDLLTHALYNLGYKCVRGSSSRGGMRGLLEMVKLIKTGGNGAITVDGPRGPRHEVKPGAVLVAQKSGAQIVPVGMAYSNCIRLKNWDRTEIPVPGSRAVMVSGEPFKIPSSISLEDGCKMVKERIFACEDLAAQKV